MATQAKVPAHLWIVGALSLIWNAFGAYDYVMTRSRNTDYLASMGMNPQELLSYIDAFPIWAQAGWGLGVWGAVLASILLLMRSRWAVVVFAASLIGALLSLGYQLIGPPAPGGMDQGAMALVPLVIIAIGAALLAYAYTQEKRGVLR